MKFLQLELSNWSVFRENQIIDLSTEDGKPIILIYGDNDKGKTSLFYSIRYVLFGENGLKSHPKPNYRELKEWANYHSAAAGDGEIHVELKIQFDDGNIKRIQRKRKFEQTPTGQAIDLSQKDELTIFDEKGIFQINDVQKWIYKNILPFDASQFFLFDGEVIQKYTDKQEQYVREAIEQVLGLSELKNAEEDLMRLNEILGDERNKKLRLVTKDEKTQRELVDLENSISETKELTDNAEIQKKIALDVIESNNKIIKQYAELRQQKDHQDELRDKIANNNKLLQDLENKLKTKRDFSGLLVLNPLLKTILKTEETPPSHQQWESKCVSYLLDNKIEKCLCNSYIDDNIKKIYESKMLDIRDNPFSILKRLVEDTFSSYRPDGLEVELNQIINNISDTEVQINTDKEAFDEISKTIQNNKNVGDDLHQREKTNNEKMKEIGRLEEHIILNKKRLDHWRSQHNTLSNKISSSTADKELKRANDSIDFVRSTSGVFGHAFNEYFKTRKEELEKYISSTFKKLTNAPEKYKSIKIGETFEIHIERTNGDIFPSHNYSPSSGAGQIVAMSVIAGFNKFTTRQCPSVIDTPLGRLDLIHRENVIDFYPLLNNSQVIILPQKGEMSDTDVEAIMENVSAIYDLVPNPSDPNQTFVRRRR